jgi:hypothetical protein
MDILLKWTKYKENSRKKEIGNYEHLVENFGSA